MKHYSALSWFDRLLYPFDRMFTSPEKHYLFLFAFNQNKFIGHLGSKNREHPVEMVQFFNTPSPTKT